MEKVRPDFPEVVDSTMIAAKRSCMQKLYLEFFEHYRFPDPNVHLHAGASYAHGLEAGRKAFYVDGKPADDCVAIAVGATLEHYGNFECPEDSGKSATRTAGAVEFYFDKYPLGVDKALPLELPDGKKAIEFGGVEPIDIKHPVTGNPILYSWRMDMAVSYNGMRFGLDDKTTSQLGASWPRQWDLRSQFTAYVWGAMMAGLPVDGFLVRGVSILKTRYDTLEAITYRPKWMIERWYTQLLLDVQDMIDAWEIGYFDYNLDHSCVEYGGCMFRNVCLAQDPTNVLEQMYERRKWDPVRRIETRLISDREFTQISAQNADNDIPF